MQIFDSHNHLQRFAKPARIIAEMRAIGIAGCVVNGTAEDDWEAVAQLAEDFPDFVQPAFGLHPWRSHERSDHWRARLEAYLDRFPDASLGECGLDGWISHPPIDTQLDAFLPQLAIARERQIPITIHALKAWQPLFDAFKTETPPKKLLLHSFGGSPELVKRLADIGTRFSFSGHFLHPRKAKTLATFSLIPLDRLLLESDAPNMLPPPECITHPLPDGENHPANLPRIATALASAIGAPPAELAAQTRANHLAFFRPKNQASPTIS
ncbi:MAG: TatD family deoxyribonuclease [Verrucomicrobia bacterium]|nr:MAG: TatD family deoxyribonuclease [Verrucomicrobiota bacterium]TAE88214.1 MAG: TatD family deoxyribonuclease [Verrucomicrobiota bacterium]TAF26099.1 MAG: TatD family deoxyribonuclease [Verrucomicrobiota bacterium]TAF40976.1 MAG: TatD family deoxyribonuclease [Verrucomicrobiota bacterium]